MKHRYGRLVLQIRQSNLLAGSGICTNGPRSKISPPKPDRKFSSPVLDPTMASYAGSIADPDPIGPVPFCRTRKLHYLVLNRIRLAVFKSVFNIFPVKPIILK
jgi:hypothetical protein